MESILYEVYTLRGLGSMKSTCYEGEVSKDIDNAYNSRDKERSRDEHIPLVLAAATSLLPCTLIGVDMCSFRLPTNLERYTSVLYLLRVGCIGRDRHH